MTIKFTFPQKEHGQRIQSIKTVDDLAQIINQLKNQQHYYLNRHIKYHFSTSAKYLHARCAIDPNCKSRFNYTKQQTRNGDIFFITKFLNQHIHEDQHPQKPPKIKRAAHQIRNLNDIGIQLSAETAEINLGLTKDRFMKAKQLIKQIEIQDFQHLSRILKSKQHLFKTTTTKFPDVKQEDIETFVGVSAKMKLNFEKYGKCLFIDIQNPICVKKHDKQFLLIFFFGLNCLRKLTIFGFGIIKSRNRETIQQAIKMFLSFQQKKVIETITIFENYDNDREPKQLSEIRFALERLIQKKVIHCQILLDRFVFLKEQQIFFNKPHKNNLILEAAKCQSQFQYKTKIEQQLLEILDKQEMKLYQKVLKNRTQFFFSCLPKTFVHGPEVCGMNIKITNFLKQRVQSTDYLQFLYSMYNSIDTLNQRNFEIIRESFPFETTYGFTRLRKCRKYLGNKIFQLVLEQVGRSRQNHVDVKQNYYLVKRLSEERKNIVDAKTFKCDCGFFEKTEIPCDHSMSILLLKNEDVFEHLGNFYKHEMLEFDKISFNEEKQNQEFEPKQFDPQQEVEIFEQEESSSYDSNEEDDD